METVRLPIAPVVLVGDRQLPQQRWVACGGQVSQLGRIEDEAKRARRTDWRCAGPLLECAEVRVVTE